MLKFGGWIRDDVHEDIDIISPYTCDVCGKENSEVAKFTRKFKILWMNFDVDTHVCQTCVSGLFRSFRKDK